MSGVSVSVKLTGPDVADILAKLIRNAAQMEAANKNIGEQILSSTKERFQDEVDPEGRKWQANADTTKKRKRNKKILQEMGEGGGLLGSLNYRADRHGVEIGTPKVYGAIHQSGGKAGRGRKVDIPARPYLGLSADDQDAIMDILGDHVLGL